MGHFADTMNVKNTYWTVALLFAASAAFGGGPFTTGPNSYHREIERTKEKEVRISLESAFGNVFIERGTSDKILVADIEGRGSGGSSATISYRVENSIGYLSMEPGEWIEESDIEGEKNWKVKGLKSGSWYLKFSDSLPLSFDISLGVGEGDFNLTGLSVKDFVLSTGASTVTVQFDEPNRSVIEHLKIESGVSKFSGFNLGNANFRSFSFSGGVGSYTLDFGGELRKEVNVNIEVGLGAVTLILPREVGARVLAEETWLSRVSVDRDFTQRSSGEYVSDNFGTADGRMQITIDAGLGSVKIKHAR